MSSNGSETTAPGRPYIGGQAVIEGVMMRSPRSFSIVVRRKNLALTVRERPMMDSRKGFFALPFVRGVVTLVEAIKLGSQSLRFSAEKYEEDHAEELNAPPPPSKKASGAGLSLLTRALVALSVSDMEPVEPSGSQGRNPMAWVMVAIALLVFVALPQMATAGVAKLFNLALDIRSPGFQVLTGLFKLIIVLGYMLAIRRIPEIRRVFQYHGAEHKAIATYEAGLPLTVDNARPMSRLHPRCGTTFLVMVVFVSILVFTGIGPLLPQLGVGKVAENVLFFLMKLPFLPLIAAITFEIQRLSARFCLTGPLRLALYPGFAVQSITTIEPDNEQMEIALGSLRATLWREQASPEGAPKALDCTYPSFTALMQQPPYGQPPSAALPRDQHATA